MGLKVLGWEVKARGTLRELLERRTFPGILFAVFFGFAYMVADRTAFFANYRYGDAIIPTQSQLVKIGPFRPQVVKSGLDRGIKFIPSNDLTNEYFLLALYFHDFEAKVASSINANSQNTVAYLNAYPSNPIQKIWGVEIDGLEVLSFEQAQENYKNTAGTTFLIYTTFFFFITFLFSVFKFQRRSKSCQQP